MTVGNGLGLAALLIAFAGLGVPFPLSYWVLWGALLMTAIALLAADRGLSIAAYILCIVGLVFFSPITLAVLFAKDESGHNPLMYVTLAMFALPIAGLMVNNANKRSPAQQNNSTSA